MSDDLPAAVGAVREKLRLTPGHAQACFRSRSRLAAGFRSDVSIREHRLVDNHCPVLDMLTTAVPVELELAPAQSPP
jgi:hypothetical protein